MELLAITRTFKILRKPLIILLGAAVGYAYYALVGCRSGACLITSNPWVSTIYGALMGWLVSGIIIKNPSQTN